MSGFTHFDEKGNAVMVDVHEKADTYRVAVAQGTITVNEEELETHVLHLRQSQITRQKRGMFSVSRESPESWGQKRMRS